MIPLNHQIRLIFDIMKRTNVRALCLLAILYLVNGCSSAGNVDYYENTHRGIRLEKPTDWTVQYDERSGVILLRTESGIWNKQSARIEISGNPCGEPIDLINGIEITERNITRIRNLYALDTVIVEHEPTQSTKQEYEIVKAVISIPTMSMEDSPRIQVGKPEPDKFQTIEIIFITKNMWRYLMAYIYKGTDERINAEAQKIVESIEFIFPRDVRPPHIYWNTAYLQSSG